MFKIHSPSITNLGVALFILRNCTFKEINFDGILKYSVIQIQGWTVDYVSSYRERDELPTVYGQLTGDNTYTVMFGKEPILSVDGVKLLHEIDAGYKQCIHGRSIDIHAAVNYCRALESLQAICSMQSMYGLLYFESDEGKDMGDVWREKLERHITELHRETVTSAVIHGANSPYTLEAFKFLAVARTLRKWAVINDGADWCWHAGQYVVYFRKSHLESLGIMNELDLTSGIESMEDFEQV